MKRYLLHINHWHYLVTEIVQSSSVNVKVESFRNIENALTTIRERRIKMDDVVLADERMEQIVNLLNNQ